MKASIINQWRKLYIRDCSPEPTKVSPKIVKSSYGNPCLENDCENHVVEGLVGDRVILLWDYGDDTPDEILEKLELQGIFALALVCYKDFKSVFAVRTFLDIPDEVQFIYLGKVVWSACHSEVKDSFIPEDLIHQKRPWMWHIPNWAWMDFVTKEIGWRDLRETVTVQFSRGVILYEANRVSSDQMWDEVATVLGYPDNEDME